MNNDFQLIRTAGRDAKSFIRCNLCSFQRFPFRIDNFRLTDEEYSLVAQDVAGELMPTNISQVLWPFLPDYDPDKWEHTMTVPMRFNRMAIYRPWLWHSSCPAFGDAIEDGRLIQLVGFQAEPAA